MFISKAFGVAAISATALLGSAGAALAASQPAGGSGAPSVSVTVLGGRSVAVSATGCSAGATAAAMWGSNQGQSIEKKMMKSSGPLVTTFWGLKPGRYTIAVYCDGASAPNPGVAMVRIPGRRGINTGDGASQTSESGTMDAGAAVAVVGAGLGAVALRRRRRVSAGS